MIPKEPPPEAEMMKFIASKWIGKPIYAAAELGIADLLADGPLSINTLAETTRTHAPSLFRLMRALAGVGIFAQGEDGRFALTPTAECLKTGKLRSAAILFNAEWSDRAWARLLDNLKTGEAAFEIAYGQPLTEWLARNPDAAAVFDDANAVRAVQSHRVIVKAIDFSIHNHVVDIGGGTGALMTEILKANPHLTGMVADVAPVVEKAAMLIRQKELTARCEAVVCDFFKAVPANADAYILSNILHDWPDDQCRTILTNCRDTMARNSTLYVIEMIVPSGNTPSIAKLLDLEMLVMTGGRERTQEEFRDLLSDAGLMISVFHHTPDTISIIEIKRSI
ncbi:MAG: methyltransferase [Desulfobacteraceae bacterium]|nr:methyltransferase [Desulfobacteraceae bacterium]